MGSKNLIQQLRERIEDMGGELLRIELIEKQRTPRFMAILPGGHIGFVDVADKDAGYRIRELRRLGCAACLIENEGQINRVINYILSDAGRDPAWLAYRHYLESFIKQGERGDPE